MKNYLDKINALSTKCIDEIKKYLKHNKSINISEFPTYVSFSTEDNVVCVRIDYIEYVEDDIPMLRFIGSDIYNNRYELDEFSDIINYAGFDLYNSVYYVIQMH